MAAVDTDWQAKRDILSSNRYMFENHVVCDVTFFVGKQRQEVKAHKYVLVSRSSVFYAMMCGLLQETGPINVPDIEPEVFERLLRYLYYEAFEPDGDSILALLNAAKKYAVGSLVDKCVNWLKDGVSVENVCSILQQAHALDEQDLQSKCLGFIMDNGSSVLKHSSFRNLSSECVEMVIKQDDLWAQEEEVYEVMKDWAGKECARRNFQPSAENTRQVLGGLKNLIRFSVMDVKYFAEKVAADDILTSDEKVRFFRSFHFGSNLDNTILKHIPRNSRYCQKERVIRFNNHTYPWGVDVSVDAIEFKCSKSVLLLGIVIYGVAQGTQVFDSNIEVKLLDESKSTIISMTCHRKISDTELHEILFDKPVVLQCSWYTITLQKSCCVHNRYGVHGQNSVRLEDGQSIEFRKSSLTKNNTTVLKGQIPGLLICRRR